MIQSWLRAFPAQILFPVPRPLSSKEATSVTHPSPNAFCDYMVRSREKGL